MTFRREPIHLGSGEPILLLHPFLCSQEVWSTVAPQLAGTGRFEVFAPTMVGHYGGPSAGNWFLLDTHVFADEIERHLDELGWQTAHIVGNSLGGWVSFELERRGRARRPPRSRPAGGWTRYSPVKFEMVGKFIGAAPRAVGRAAARAADPGLPFARAHRHLPVSGPADGPDDADLVDPGRRRHPLHGLRRNCWSSRYRAGPRGARPTSKAPVQLVLCGK